VPRRKRQPDEIATSRSQPARPVCQVLGKRRDKGVSPFPVRLLQSAYVRVKMPRGSVIETTQLGMSTASLILRSPATLHSAYAS